MSEIPASVIQNRLSPAYVVLGLLLILIAGFAGFYFAALREIPPPPTTETQPAAAAAPLPWQNPPPDNALRDRLTDLEARVKLLETAASEPPVLAPPNDFGHFEKLQSELVAQGDALAELRISTENNNRRLAAIVLWTQVKEAVIAGHPYADRWKEFSAIWQKPIPESAILEQQAGTGVPTFTDLRNRFHILVGPALSPEGGKLEKTLGSLIRIRKTGAHQKGTDNEAIIARAEAALAEGNISGTLKIIETLSPPAADVMSAWRADAQRYLATAAALNAVSATVFAP